MTEQNGSGFHLVRADRVTPTKVNWLWPQRIALGKLSVIVGNPGTGKSMLTADIASRISAGRPLPGVSSSAPPPAPGGVILLSAEDDPADTVVPRLHSHGADLGRIRLLPPVYCCDKGSRVVHLSDNVDQIAAAIDATPGCKLVVIDPVSAFLGKIDTFRDSDVRSALTPLSNLASVKGVAIVCIMHLAKKEAQAIHRSNGSIAFSAASRAVWLLAKRSDPERRVFVPVKLNLASDLQGGLGFTIRENELGLPVIRWESEPVMVTADQALQEEMLPSSNSSKAKPRDIAKDWLRDALSVSPKTANWIRSEAKEHGISNSTLERARDDLGIEEIKIDGKPHWQMSNEQNVVATAV